MRAIIGVDEVGRGCWAGPLVAAAVRLDTHIPGLKDSKLLSAQRRKVLAAQTMSTCSYGLGWVSGAEVDALGLTEATALAMHRALEQLGYRNEDIVVDGSINFLADYPRAQAVVKADQTVPAVSAASIVAKVARDNHMTELHALFPQYGFDRHVGYGTRLHQQMIALHGICEQHRRSFKPIKALLEAAGV